MVDENLGGMSFDPGALPRLATGDEGALDSIVTFSDGTQKQLRDCDKDDLEVMNAWAAYKSANASRTLALMHAERNRRRRQNIKAVPSQ